MACSRWTSRAEGLVSDFVGKLRDGMATINVHAAKTHFSRLLERVEQGEEVVIARAGKPVARLVPMEPAAEPRRPGSARGLAGSPRTSTRRCRTSSWPPSADAAAARHARLPLVGVRRPAPLVGRPRPDRRSRGRDPVQRRQRLGDRDQGPHRPARPAGGRAGFVHDQVRRNRLLVLPIELRHALRVHALPDHHRDPFDRLLVAQAQSRPCRCSAATRCSRPRRGAALLGGPERMPCRRTGRSMFGAAGRWWRAAASSRTPMAQGGLRGERQLEADESGSDPEAS